MPFKKLHQHPVIQLVHKDKVVNVPIAYSDEQNAFEFVLTDYADLDLPDDLPRLITPEMAHRLIFLPDGTIQLRL